MSNVADNLHVTKDKYVPTRIISAQQDNLLEIISRLAILEPKTEDDLIKGLYNIQDDLFNIIIDITTDDRIFMQIFKEFLYAYTTFISNIGSDISKNNKQEFDSLFKDKILDYLKEYDITLENKSIKANKAKTKKDNIKLKKDSTKLKSKKVDGSSKSKTIKMELSLKKIV